MSLRISVICCARGYIVYSIFDFSIMRLLQLIFLASLRSTPGTEGDGKHLGSPRQLVENGRILFFSGVVVNCFNYYLLLLLVS